jgi:hypothetical protein
MMNRTAHFNTEVTLCHPHLNQLGRGEAESLPAPTRDFPRGETWSRDERPQDLKEELVVRTLFSAFRNGHLRSWFVV